MDTTYDESFPFISIVSCNDDVIVKRSVSDEFMIVMFFFCPLSQRHFLPSTSFQVLPSIHPWTQQESENLFQSVHWLIVHSLVFVSLTSNKLTRSSGGTIMHVPIWRECGSTTNALRPNHITPLLDIVYRINSKGFMSPFSRKRIGHDAYSMGSNKFDSCFFDIHVIILY